MTSCCLQKKIFYTTGNQENGPAINRPNKASYWFFTVQIQLFRIFAAAGLTRPAPAEPPQGRKAARISGCSGAM